MPQTAYNDLIDGQHFYEGQLIYAEPAYIFTGYNEQGGIIPFGRAVVKGTNDEDLRLPAAAADVFQGIAFLSDTFEKRDGYSVDADENFGYPDQYTVSRVKRGTVAVRIDGPVTKGQPAYWRHTAAGAQRAGTFSATAADSTLIPNSSFDASGVAGDIVPLSINLP